MSILGEGDPGRLPKGVSEDEPGGGSGGGAAGGAGFGLPTSVLKISRCCGPAKRARRPLFAVRWMAGLGILAACDDCEHVAVDDPSVTAVGGELLAVGLTRH